MFKIRSWSQRPLLVGAAIVTIIVAGLIHLVQGPQQYAEAPYVGILFYLNAACAAVAAYGIYRGAKTWGWGLGMFVAGGAMVMFVVSRTVGLPGMDIQEWGEPIGLLALIVEGLFLVLSVVYLRRYAAAPAPPTRCQLLKASWAISSRILKDAEKWPSNGSWEI